MYSNKKIDKNISKLSFAFKPFNWLKNAVIYNKKNEVIPTTWIKDNTDVLLLLFTAKGVDKDGLINNFYTIYENVKYINLPIEVIYVPLDETEEEMKESYEDQANWFTLKFDDPLVHELKYMYEVTCLPHIVVLKSDCSIISKHGLLDLEQYGKNAVITWLSTTGNSKIQRKLSKDMAMYGDKWKYLNVGPNTGKPDYSRKFSNATATTQDVQN